MPLPSHSAIKYQLQYHCLDWPSRFSLQENCPLEINVIFRNRSFFTSEISNNVVRQFTDIENLSVSIEKVNTYWGFASETNLSCTFYQQNIYYQIELQQIKDVFALSPPCPDKKGRHYAFCDFTASNIKGVDMMPETRYHEISLSFQRTINPNL